MQEKDEGLEWQIGVWDRISQIYLDEIDKRFMPIVRHCVELAGLRPGEAVLDLGTGTGKAAVEAGRKVGARGSVFGVDVSPEMVRLAEARIKSLSLNNVRAVEGSRRH